MRCAAITKGGSRCRLEATYASYCYQHAPETLEARKRRARRGGRAGGNGRAGVAEVTEAKSWIRGLISKTLRGEVERDVATASFMGLNCLARYIELERRIREQDELLARVEALEASEAEERKSQVTNGKRGAGRWR
jgi:hypothetical protein